MTKTISWDKIESDPAYTSLSNEDKGVVKSEWFKEHIGKSSEFKSLEEQDRLTVINNFFGNEISDPEPEGSLWGDIPKSLVRGLDSVGASIGGVMEMAHIPGGTWVKELYETRGARPEIARPKYLQEGTVIDKPERLADPRWWVNMVGENLPNMATMIAPGAGAYRLTKAAGFGIKAAKKAATVGSVLGGFTVEAGSAYNDAKDEMIEMGYDENTAQSIATVEGLIVGTVNSLLEAAPFHVLLKNKGAKKALVRVVRQALWEGGTEAVQENVNMIAAELGHKPDRKWNDWLGRTIESGLAGVVMGGGMGMFEGDQDVAQPKQQITPQPTIDREKILTGLVNNDLTIQDLADLKEGMPPEDIAEIDAAIQSFEQGRPNAPEIKTEPIQEIEPVKELFPKQTPEEQAQIEKDIMEQREGKTIERMNALASLWGTLSETEKKTAAKLIVPSEEETAIETERKTKEQKRDFTKTEEIRKVEQERKAKEKMRYGKEEKPQEPELVETGRWEEPDADRIRAKTEKASQEKEMVEGEKERLRLRDTEKNRMETEQGEIVEPQKAEKREPEKPVGEVAEKVSSEKAETLKTKFDKEISLLKEGIEQRKKQLRNEFFKTNRIVIEQKNGIKRVLTKSARTPNKFQLTYIQEDGTPTGHEEYDDFANAIEDLATETVQEARPDFPDWLGLGSDIEHEYIYESTLRPVGINMSPKDGLIRTEKGGKFGRLIYDRILTKEELDHFSLKPIGNQIKTLKSQQDLSQIDIGTPKGDDSSDKEPRKGKKGSGKLAVNEFGEVGGRGEITTGTSVRYKRGKYNVEEIENGRAIISNARGEKIVNLSELSVWSKRLPRQAPTEKRAIGKAWIDNQQRPIIDAYEFKRGRNKGNYRVTLPDGSKKIVERDGVKLEEQKQSKQIKSITKTIKNETGSSEIANDIYRKAADLIQEGVDNFGRFRREMQKAFKNVWDKIKKHMHKLWEILKDQKGQVDVWHGSPHRFKRFTTEKIGTGEGAQAFGWGLYFTDQESIGRYYAKYLKDIKKPKLRFTEKETIERLINTKGFENDTYETFVDWAKQWGYEQGNPDSLAVVVENAWRSNAYISERDAKSLLDIPQPNLYKATLHKGKDPSEYSWLDWEIPLDQQSEKTKQSIEPIVKKFEKFMSDTQHPVDRSIANGQDLYNWMRGQGNGRFGSGKMGASLKLLSDGIDGIRYPAGTLSGGGKGTNYVVFDENAVTIEKITDLLGNELGSSELINDIAYKASELINSGVNNIKEFTSKMKDAFPKIWDKIKKHIKALWYIVSNQRGSIGSIGKFQKIYRGELASQKGKGYFWTTDAEWARQFTQSGRDSEIKTASIKKDDIFRPKTPIYAGDPDAVDNGISEARKGGFKAIWLDEGKNEPDSIFIFDKTTIKSQRNLRKLESQRGEITIGKEGISKERQAELMKRYAKTPQVKQKEKFDKQLHEDTVDSINEINRVSKTKAIWKFIRPGKLTRQGKKDLSYMWDLMLSVPEFFKQKIGAVERIYQAQQDRMDEYHEHIYQMENQDTVNVVDSLKRLKKQSRKAYRKVKDHLVETDRSGNGFRIGKDNDKWTVYDPKNNIVKEFDSNITEDGTDSGEVQAVEEMIQAEAKSLSEQGFTPEQIESVTAFRLTTNKGFELLFRSMRNLRAKFREAGLPDPTIETWEAGEKQTLTLEQAMAQMGDMRGVYFPRIRPKGRFVLTATKGDDKILRTFNLQNTMSVVKTQLEAQGYKVETGKNRQIGEDVFELSGDLVKTQQILTAAIEKAEKVLSGPFVEGKTELTESVKKLNQDFQRVFEKAVSEQVANIIRGRGSRVHMTKRNPEVWTGYEEDPQIAIAKYIRGLAGGEAKRNASMKMLHALTGTDISWNEFKEQEFLKGRRKVEYEEYIKFVRERMISGKEQPNAFKWAKAYISEMTRNREMSDEVIGFVKGIAVGKYLAFRVLSAPLVNITALPTSVVATLKGAGIPYAQSWKYLGKGLSNYGKYIRYMRTNKTDDLVFKTIKEKGWDNPQFSSESIQTLRSQLGRGWDKVIDLGMFTFSESERLNRVATIYAAYHGLKSQNLGLDNETLLEKAKELSDKSHGVYNKGNHPYIALGNNPAAKLAQMFYVFRTFSHTYLLNMRRLGLDKQWGAVAHMVLAPAVIAGAGASVMTPIISGLLKMFGFDEPEEELYKYIGENWNPEAEQWARFGLAGAGGGGVSIKGSLAIGIGDLPTRIEDLFGAPGSIGKDIYYGAKSLKRGDVSKGVEKLTPTGFGNLLRAYREYNEGLTTWNNAPKFYGTERLKASKFEAFMRGFSLNPARLAGISEQQWKERKVEEKYRQWRTDIYAKLKRFYLSGGTDEEFAELLGVIENFNERAARWNLSPITPKSIRMNIKRSFKPSKRERMRQ